MLGGLGQTQQKLLTTLLENKEGLTIDKIVKSLGISKTAVHQHVNSLEKNGYVEKDVMSKTKGRPGQIYVLSSKGVHLFPKQYAWFSDAMLDKLAAQLGSDGLESFLREIGENIADSTRHQVTAKNKLAVTEQIIGLMEQLGFKAMLAPSSTERMPIIKAYNCVYHQLAAKHEEVCSLDLSLISSLSGCHVEHTACMLRGGKSCSFKLGTRLKSSQTSGYQTLSQRKIS